MIRDLRMPILNGLETYAELKNKGLAVPTIIVTAYAEQEVKVLEELKSLSVTEILKKPFDPQELFNALARLTR